MQVPVELKKKYLDRRIQDIHNLRDSLESNDYSLALKIGHQVKGNAVTFEFPQIAGLGLEMETAARKRDKEKVKILIEKMESLILKFQGSF